MSIHSCTVLWFFFPHCLSRHLVTGVLYRHSSPGEFAANCFVITVTRIVSVHSCSVFVFFPLSLQTSRSSRYLSRLSQRVCRQIFVIIIVIRRRPQRPHDIERSQDPSTPGAEARDLRGERLVNTLDAKWVFVFFPLSLQTSRNRCYLSTLTLGVCCQIFVIVIAIRTRQPLEPKRAIYEGERLVNTLGVKRLSRQWSV